MQTQIANGFRISPQQKRLWLLMHGEKNHSYSVKFAIKINGNLKTDILRASVENIIAQQEILRTHFSCLSEMVLPLQCITESRKLFIHEHDMSSFPLEEQQTKIETLFQEFNPQIYNLQEDTPFYITLIKSFSDKHILFIGLPALYGDVETLNNFVEQLSCFYTACLYGKNFSEESIQYADVSEWLNELLESQDTETGRKYWQEQDISSIFSLKAPLESCYLTKTGFDPLSLSLTIGYDTLEKIETFINDFNTPISLFLLACWHTLLWQLERESDIIVATACNGRKYQDLKQVFGLLTKYLPTYCSLNKDVKFREVLKNVAESSSHADKWQEYFDWEKVTSNNNNSSEPLFFPFGFDFKEDFVKDVEGELSFSLFKRYECIDRFKLKLSCFHRKEVLDLNFYYDSSLFSIDSIQVLSEQYLKLLESIINNPESTIGDLNIISQFEQQRLLEFNDTKTNYPQNKCFHQLFEEQVELTPDSVAVVYENQTLTYAQLNAKANQLAHYLQTLEIKAEVLVAICVERSPEVLIGLLAILKAGGAYVPIDPAYPKERLSLILSDAQASVLLTQKGLIDHLPEHSAKVVCLDEWETIAQYSQRNPAIEVTHQNLAYVIYTSGSTGTPKGTLIPHQGLVNYLTWCTQAYAVSEGEGTLVHSSISFDMSITGLFSPLLVGKKVELLPEITGIDSLAIALQNRSNLSLVKITPAHLDMLSHQLLPEQAAGRTRWLIVGGENLLAQSTVFWQDVAPDTITINEYGPTETVVGCCTYQVPHGKHQSGSIPIGRPIANTQLHILDEDLRPVPIGVTGELYIGGDGLGRGYLNRPDLTAERFIPNPFDYEEGARLYKTGDLACYSADGIIQYLGRIDHQVKIRGFRIELGEIEAVLSQHPDVLQNTVIDREDVPGDRRLVAYVVLNQNSAPTTSDLRCFLEQKLPSYMVPSTFVILDNLPLTVNGKVDRSQLKAPELSSEVASFVAPRTPIEEMLAFMWAELLKVNQVGIYDNFFTLGGHSLLATQLISQVRTNLSVELPVSSLFENPTVFTFAQCVERTRSLGLSLVAPPILPSPRNVEIPLSFAQARLWFLDQLEPGNPFYNIYNAVHLEGKLNVAALEVSINEIIRRHEALRTNFTVREGRPVQVITPNLTIPLPVEELQHLLETESQITSQQLAKQEALRPFDLTCEPLVRAKLLKLAETEHILLLTMHHIISDGWSMGILVRELAAVYEAECNHLPLKLPQLSIQYADFATWQRQWLQGDVLEAQLTYWKQQLNGIPALLELSTDRPRPAIATFQGANHRFTLSPKLSEELVALSKKQGVTLFMILLAVYQILLHRYTNQDDICVGTPIANRNHSEIEGLIGFFVNTLVIRTNLSENPSFEDVLSRVREAALGAYAHQDLPFEQLVEELQPERSLSHAPLFQVMFILQNAPMPSLELPNLKLSSLPVESTTSKFDLTLALENTNQGLVGSLKYNTDLFDATTITRMVRHFENLLEAIVTNPHQRVSNLPLFSRTEQQQLLVEWNHSTADYPQDLCIHQLFEAQVTRSPNAVALVFGDQSLTYQELNNRANKLAHYLKELGVGPETLVGICVDRSLEMVQGLLAILKAGAAYVPLDPNHPKERLALILEEATIKVLLTQQRLVDNLPEQLGRVICLDTDWIHNLSIDNLTQNITADHLAYIIYTSGSTGRPKGVQITHRSVVNLLTSMSHQPGLESHDVLLALTTISFDIAALEIFLPLIVGARLVVANQEVASDSYQLAALLNTSQATLMQATPATWQMLITSGWTGNTQLKILCGGEALPRVLANQLLALGKSVWNMYGPTESTIWSATTKIEFSEGLVPIGRVIANTQFYILDSQLQPLPVGVPGELHIGGDGLARGYFHRPELTAQTFIPNPFSHQQGARLYKTGDLVRYLPDGHIEFLNRIDHQVKIRGFRIELGEIELVLCQHSTVEESVVIASHDNSGDHRLVAYLVPLQERSPNITELRQFLKQRLPEYMIPNTFVILDTLPLTPNGKINRRALPTPEASSETVETPPRTPTEETVVSIWKKVLGLKQISIHENFFEIGGHSLLATQVISQLREAFSINIPLRRLFELPTVAELSESLDATRYEQQSQILPPITSVNRDQKLPLSFAQERLWITSQLEGESAIYNIPAAVRLTGNLNIRALEQASQEIVRRHEALRTNFSIMDGSPILVIGYSTTITLPLVDLQILPEVERKAETQRLLTEAIKKPFDLSKDLLLRITLLQTGQKEYVLLVTMHHIISDGWSMGIFIRELNALYKAFSQGMPSPLPELAVQYADFTHWQRQWFTREALQTQLNYWKQQLAGTLPTIELPTDYPRPKVGSLQAGSQWFELDTELTEQLKTLSQKLGTTMFMTLLAGFKTLLYYHTGQEDIIVGTDIANRNRTETEQLIGFFVNQLVLRTNLGGNPTFSKLLSQVRQVTLEAYANQDLPFQKLVQELQPERSLNSTPLFQTKFIFQNAPLEALELPGLTLSSIKLDSEAIQFDLVLSMHEGTQGLAGTLYYSTDLFKATTITQLLKHFQNLLRNIVRNPNQELSNLSILTDEEINGSGITELSNSQIERQDFEALLLELSKISDA